MSDDLNVSMIMRLVDRVTGPHRAVINSVRQIGGAVDGAGAGMIARANAMDHSIRAQKASLGASAIETAGWAGAMYAAIRPAVEFEAAMDRVGAVGRMGDEELQRVIATARELGGSTNWKASEVAEGMQFLAMTGFDTNQIIATMPGLLDLASAAALDLGQTSDIASNILSGFRLEASEMGRVSDVLTNSFTGANIDLTMLGETMKYVASTAREAGLSVEETAAMAGLLGDAGIQGSMGGTALRAIISRLAGPTGGAAAALKKLGIETADASGNLRSVPDILAEMHAAMDGLGSAERINLSKTIFGEEASNSGMILMLNAASGKLGEFTQEMYATGSAARVAAEQNDNVLGMIKQIGSVVEAISITVSTVFLPSIREIGDTIKPMLEKVNAWAEANPELVKSIGQLAVGLVAARVAMMGMQYGVLTLLQPLVGLVRISGVLLRGLGLMASLNPFGLIALSAVAAWYVIRANWGQITEWFTAKIDAVRAAFDVDFVQGLTALLAEFNPFTLLQETLSGLADLAAPKLAELLALIERTIGGNALYETGKGLIQSLWNGAEDRLGSALDLLQATITGRVRDVSLFDQGGAMIAGLQSGALARVGEFKDWLLSWVEELGGPILSSFDQGMAEGIGAVVATLLILPADLAAQGVSAALDLLAATDWSTLGASVMAGVTEGAVSAITGLTGLISATMSGDLEGYGWAAVGVSILASLKTGMANVITPRIEEIARDLKAAFGEISLIEQGRALISSLWTGTTKVIEEMIADLRARIEGILPGWAVRLISSDDEGTKPNVIPEAAPLTSADVSRETTVHKTTNVGAIHVHAQPGQNGVEIAGDIQRELAGAGGGNGVQFLHDQPDEVLGQ